MHFKTYIKNLRISNGLSQPDFAKELGVSLSTIKKIECGQTKHPGKKLLSNIAKFENKTEIEVLTNLIFNDTEKDNKETIFCNRFIAYMFSKGWNIINLNPTYNNHSFIAEICQRNAPIYNALVSDASKYISSNLKNETDIIFNFIKPTLQINKETKKHYIVFDSNNKQNADTYYLLKSKKIYNLKIKIIIFLFDSNTCRLIEEYNLN